MSKKKSTKGKAQKKAAMADGLELSAAHRKALDKAERLRLAKGKGVTRRRAEAAAIGRRVEAERACQREVRQVAAGVDETVALAKARGERVVVEEVVRAEFARGDHGELVCVKDRPVLLTQTVVHRRIRDRDGLRDLFDDGKLGQRERLVGEAFRYLVENAPGRLGSSLEEKTSGGPAARSDAFVVAALYRAYVGVRLTAVERAFGRREDGIAELRVLRAVAGEGCSLRSLGDGPNVRKANLARLKRALAVADRAISEARSIGACESGPDKATE